MKLYHPRINERDSLNASTHMTPESKGYVTYMKLYHPRTNERESLNASTHMTASLFNTLLGLDL